MAVFYEPGYSGELVSLGGVRGITGRGRKIEILPVTVFGAELIRPANPQRISLLVVNCSINDGYVGIGVATPNALLLRAGGSFQIDTNFPSILEVWGYSTISSGWSFIEISLL